MEISAYRWRSTAEAKRQHQLELLVELPLRFLVQVMSSNAMPTVRWLFPMFRFFLCVFLFFVGLLWTFVYLYLAKWIALCPPSAQRFPIELSQFEFIAEPPYVPSLLWIFCFYFFAVRKILRNIPRGYQLSYSIVQLAMIVYIKIVPFTLLSNLLIYIKPPKTHFEYFSSSALLHIDFDTAIV